MLDISRQLFKQFFQQTKEIWPTFTNIKLVWGMRCSKFNSTKSELVINYTGRIFKTHVCQQINDKSKYLVPLPVPLSVLMCSATALHWLDHRARVVCVFFLCGKNKLADSQSNIFLVIWPCFIEFHKRRNGVRVRNMVDDSDKNVNR